jgi:hypothetical protein
MNNKELRSIIKLRRHKIQNKNIRQTLKVDTLQEKLCQIKNIMVRTYVTHVQQGCSDCIKLKMSKEQPLERQRLKKSVDINRRNAYRRLEKSGKWTM